MDSFQEVIRVPEDGVTVFDMSPAAILAVEIHSDAETDPIKHNRETEGSTKHSRIREIDKRGLGTEGSQGERKGHKTGDLKWSDVSGGNHGFMLQLTVVGKNSLMGIAIALYLVKIILDPGAQALGAFIDETQALDNED